MVFKMLDVEEKKTTINVIEAILDLENNNYELWQFLSEGIVLFLEDKDNLEWYNLKKIELSSNGLYSGGIFVYKLQGYLEQLKKVIIWED